MAAVPGLGKMCWGDWVRLTAHVIAIDPVRTSHVRATAVRLGVGAGRRLAKRLVGTSPVPSRPTHGPFQGIPQGANQFVWIISRPAWENCWWLQAYT